MWKFKYMAMNSDVVVVGNRFLRDQALRYVDPNRVTLIPTAIDINSYPKKKTVSQKERTILGWIGTRSTLKYLRDLDDVLGRLAKRFSEISLKIVCDEFYDSSTIPVIKKRWSLEEENDDLVSFDIGLMPLRDDLWSRGKCGLKIIQYQCVGLPVVCTPVGINRDIIRDGYNGFWATTPREWLEKLSALIEKEDLRSEMGAHGMRTVENEFSLDVTSEKLLAVFRRVSSQ
jgi:glycosyltransferase involved in cell wall biosynthesis